MHYMKWIYPRRLRNQMILMAILMVIVPTLTIGYIVETEGRSAVLSEKEKKLSAVVNLLNQALGNRYDLYIDLPREERIRALGSDSNLLIVFYVQIMPDDLVMQLHRF